MQLDDLALPSGNKVSFRDSEDLNGEEYELLRGKLVNNTTADAVLAMQRTMAELLIDSWSFKHKIPTERGPAGAWAKLGWRDVKALHAHVTPVVVEMFLTPDEDPDAYASGSADNES